MKAGSVTGNMSVSNGPLSRLETLIFRFNSQKNHLDRAMRDRDVLGGGIVVEVGLGSGRTFDHIRCNLTGRDLFAFDFSVQTHPGCEPEDHQLVLGEVAETLPVFVRHHLGQAALVHLDIGSKDRERDQVLYNQIKPDILNLLKLGGVLVADRPMENSSLITMEKIDSDKNWPYFSYKKVAGSIGKEN